MLFFYTLKLLTTLVSFHCQNTRASVASRNFQCSPLFVPCKDLLRHYWCDNCFFLARLLLPPRLSFVCSASVVTSPFVFSLFLVVIPLHYYLYIWKHREDMHMNISEHPTTDNKYMAQALIAEQNIDVFANLKEKPKLLCKFTLDFHRGKLNNV